MFPWVNTPEERIVSEIEDELLVYKNRCIALHGEFRARLRLRDEARAELKKAEDRLATLRMESLSLLRSFNTAMIEDDEERIKELEHAYKTDTRDLARAQRTKDAAARRLQAVDIEDEKAVSDLKNAASEVLEEYAERIRERKQWLASLSEILDSKQRELVRDAAPLTGDYEPRRPPGESPVTEEKPREG